MPSMLWSTTMKHQERTLPAHGSCSAPSICALSRTSNKQQANVCPLDPEVVAAGPESRAKKKKLQTKEGASTMSLIATTTPSLSRPKLVRLRLKATAGTDLQKKRSQRRGDAHRHGGTQSPTQGGTTTHQARPGRGSLTTKPRPAVVVGRRRRASPRPSRPSRP